jgi:hypothetical protein
VVGYLICEGDRVLPLEFQDFTVPSVAEAEAEVEPFLSQERLVLEAVEDFAKRNASKQRHTLLSMR